jgi:ZIP family zinc transporter
LYPEFLKQGAQLVEFTQSEIILAFSLTLLAGLSTGIGSALAFFAKKTDKRILSIVLGFSAGVMIYVAFIELLPIGISSMAEKWMGPALFFLGMIIMAIFDKMLPEPENPHHHNEYEKKKHEKRKLHRLGLFAAVVLAIHNFPEGLATFVAALSDPVLGVSIAVAIALHNIPEGIAVSVPLLHATGSKKKAFIYSFLTGLTEPIGAALGFLILLPFLNDALLGAVFAFVGGIMVYISLDELLPASRECGEAHLSIYGIIAGMIVMAASMVVF